MVFTWVCFKCVFKRPLSEKVLGHWLKGHGFSPMCILKCFFKLPPTEKVLWHWLQGNDFSPDYVLKCDFKLSTYEKDLGDWLQGNDFLPECALKITFKLYRYRSYTEDYVLWDYVELEIITFSKIYCVVTELWKEIFCHRLHRRLCIMWLCAFLEYCNS